MRLPAWFALALSGAVLAGSACAPRSTLPTSLSDQEFWSLSAALSEPPGVFTLSENFVSNEPDFVERVRVLQPTGGVYVGVGPEQNFSYIARVRPAMAFVIDIRRENLALHLLYKALFELSSDRVDFVSRLFSRPRPPGLRSDATVDDIFLQYDHVAPSLDLYNQNAALVRIRLLTTRALPLSQTDLDWIDRSFKAFYADGPNIDFWGARPGKIVRPSYRALMTAKDFLGQQRSFLATDEGFRFVKNLEARNLIVPVVGDFSGPRAIRRVGDYVREHGDVITAFYGSNVGVYLTKPQIRTFCASLATLPAAPAAWFIESNDIRPLAAKLSACLPP